MDTVEAERGGKPLVGDLERRDAVSIIGLDEEINRVIGEDPLHFRHIEGAVLFGAVDVGRNIPEVADHTLER